MGTSASVPRSIDLQVPDLKVMSIFGLGIQELPQLLGPARLVSWLVLAAEVQWEGTHNRALSCPDAVRRSLDLLLLGHEAS